MPESLSIKNLISFLESEKERCIKSLKECEDALKTAKRSQDIEYWQRERDSLKDRAKGIEERLAFLRKINS